MTEQEAKILASELANNRTWRVPRINHGMDEVDGWYVVIELRERANYRALLSDIHYATPQRIAGYQQVLETTYLRHQAHGKVDSGMLFVPLPDGWVVMP